MSIQQKKHILSEYFRKIGKIPTGIISIDSDNADMGNVSVNGCYYGTFDYIRKQFIDIA